ncbi:MAG: hypothetical protein ACUVV3_01280 [Dehalococcoidia bacterium]
MRRELVWLAALTAAATAFALPTFVYGVTPKLLYPYPQNSFYNYDFTDDRPYPAYVSWPIGLVWRCGATVGTVHNYFKTGLGPGYPRSGGIEYEYVWQEGQAAHWDNDGGRQTNPYWWGGNCWARHSRIYAPNGYRFYNPSWQYFVIASQHYDINHWSGCPGPDLFGYSEEVEDIIRYEADEEYTVGPDKWYNMQNYGYFWMDASHYHQSDGYASYVCFQ